MSPIRLGLIALVCWLAYSVFLVSDLYLRFPVVAIALRLLVPWALLANLLALTITITRIRKQAGRQTALALILNAIPPAVAAAFFLWLFVGFKM